MDKMVTSDKINKDINFSIFLALIKSNWKFLVKFVMFGLIIIVIYSFITPAKFEAVTTIMPPDENEKGSGLSGMLQSMSGNISIGGLSKSSKSEIYSDLIQSRSVAQYVSEKCSLENHYAFKAKTKLDHLKNVQKSLDVWVSKSGILSVQAVVPTLFFPSGKDYDSAAVLSARIANCAVEGLDFVNKTKNSNKAKRKMTFIGRVLDENKLKLDSIDRTMMEFQQSNKVLAIDEQTKAIMTNAVNVGVELTKAEIELGLVSQDYSQESQIYKTYKSRVADLQDQYKRVQSGGLVKSDEFSIPLSEVPELIKIYTNLIRDQKILTQILLFLETQKYQEALQAQSDVPTIEILDSAILPSERSSPNRKMMLLLGFVLLSIAGISYIIIRTGYRGQKEVNNS